MLAAESRRRQAKQLADGRIQANPEEFERTRTRFAQQIRAKLRYQGADGREYLYLARKDSYYWMHAARTLLRTGSMCDAIVDGECRDNFVRAPVGEKMAYPYSMHVASFAGLQ